MKNFTLAGIAQSIPYYPRLGVLLGLVSSIVMVQLEFLFGLQSESRREDGSVEVTQKFTNGFYKYLAPPAIQVGEDGRIKPAPVTYKVGDSWSEWLGCTPDVFQTAFQKIGTAYGSVTKFNQACREGDPFQKKFYMSVFDHKQNLTHYYRNHGLVDKFISDFGKNIAQPIENKRNEEIHDPDRRKSPIQKGGKTRSGKVEKPDPEKDKRAIPVSEFTADITQKLSAEKAEAASEAEAASGLASSDPQLAECESLMSMYLRNETDFIRWRRLIGEVDHAVLLEKIKEIIRSGKNPFTSTLMKGFLQKQRQNNNKTIAYSDCSLSGKDMPNTPDKLKNLPLAIQTALKRRGGRGQK